MRIDAHQHFWRYDPVEYGWIGESMKRLRDDFLPHHLAGAASVVEIDGFIAVQARTSPAETDWLLELADEHEMIRGVVGWVDLCADDVDDRLERWAGRDKLKGIRHVVQDEPDDMFLLRDDFCRGVARLAERELLYEILVYPRQLPAAVKFVERFPDQAFVLDHVAKPYIKDGEVDPWRDEIRELATYPNVSCKVSGMVTEARWDAWTHGDFRPYLDVVFDAFGPDRLMFGSDWPVCLLAASYTQVAAIVDEYVTTLGVRVHDAVFGGTAARVYDLEGD